MEDAGQDNADLYPTDQVLTEGRISSQNVHRHIDKSRPHSEESGCQLLPGGDLNGQFRTGSGTGNVDNPLRLSRTGRIPAGTLGSQCVEGIPPQTVNYRGGQGKTRFHDGPHAFAQIGGPAGFAETGNENLLSQLCNPGNFRFRSLQSDSAALRVGNGQAAAVQPHLCAHDNGHKALLRSLIGLPDGFHPSGVLALFLPDAKHMASDSAGIVAVSKALPVKGSIKLIHHGFGDFAGVDGGPVYLRHCSHIFRPLHPSLQLEGGHTHIFQLLHVVYQTVILETQGVAVLPAVIAVALTAWLGAAAPVSGPSADCRRQIALTGIAHAQCAVTEHFNFDGGVLADIADLLTAQLPAENYPLETPCGAELHPGQGVNGHLGGAVNGNFRGNLSAETDNPQILHDERIHTAGGCLTDQGRCSIGFLIRYQSVQRQVDGNTPDMAVFCGFCQSLRGKIFGALTGVKLAAAKINGVGAVLHCGTQGIHRPCRC